MFSTDLSKAFDYMTQGLLIAKLHELNFDMNALNSIFNYLARSKQRMKINSCFSSCMNLFQGVRQRSTLGPLLFNLFLCDIFLFVEEADIISYSEDKTLYMCSKSFDVALEN